MSRHLLDIAHSNKMFQHSTPLTAEAAAQGPPGDCRLNSQNNQIKPCARVERENSQRCDSKRSTDHQNLKNQLFSSGHQQRKRSLCFWIRFLSPWILGRSKGNIDLAKLEHAFPTPPLSKVLMLQKIDNNLSANFVTANRSDKGEIGVSRVEEMCC